MIKTFKLNQPNYTIGLIFATVLTLTGCQDDKKLDDKPSSDKELTNLEIEFILPVDSLSYNYSSESWKVSTRNYSENRYGQNMFLDSAKCFLYTSINSDNEFHTFNFKTNEHKYTEPIFKGKIDAYKIDSSFIYLIYNNLFYIKDYQLNTIDSFSFTPPNINKKHAIDFSVENNSNLFRINNYFAIMYYVVDEKIDGTNVYKNHNPLFYYFNRDTSFFASKGCNELDSSFQYFRYPAVTSDLEYLYHTPRVQNCISKSNEIKTLINSTIDTLKDNYLTFKHEDQYEISKLKKHRFSTDYNRDIITTNENIFLLKEIPSKIYYENDIRSYEHVLELKKFDKELNLMGTYFIEDSSYSFAFIEKGKLYLFKFKKNKYYVYEV